MAIHRQRFAAAVCGALATTLVAGAARADEPAPAVTTVPTAPTASPPPPTDVDPYATFPLVHPHEKHYTKASLELGGILAVGLVDYLLSTSARGGTTRPGDVRWGLRYDWPLLRDKLIGTGLNLDSNKNPTNYVGHPFAGTLYYTSARSNHLSFAEAYAFAILGSTTWEYFGEIREITSINDLIVTPVSGAAIGETFMQLSGFLRRGRRTLPKDIASVILAPWKWVNEWTDGAEPLPATRLTKSGLPLDTWHRFTVSVGAGATVQEAEGPTHPRASYVDERFGLETRLVSLPGYASGGKHSHLFDDGNISSMRIDVALSQGHLVDGLFATKIVPVGYWYRDAEEDAAGRVRGSSAFVGLRMAFEYGGHDYDRDRFRSSDTISLASPIGVAAEYRWTQGDFELRTSLDVMGALSSVTPYALTSYLRAGNTLDNVLTPVRFNGYYHAVDVAAEPTLEFGYRGLRSTTRLRIDTFREIAGLDEQQSVVASGPHFEDRRSLLRSTLSYVPPGTPWRLSLDGQRAQRNGRAASIEDERAETSAWASLGVEF